MTSKASTTPQVSVDLMLGKTEASVSATLAGKPEFQALVVDWAKVRTQTGKTFAAGTKKADAGKEQQEQASETCASYLMALDTLTGYSGNGRRTGDALAGSRFLADCALLSIPGTRIRKAKERLLDKADPSRVQARKDAAAKKAAEAKAADANDQSVRLDDMSGPNLVTVIDQAEAKLSDAIADLSDADLAVYEANGQSIVAACAAERVRRAALAEVAEAVAV